MSKSRLKVITSYTNWGLNAKIKILRHIGYYQLTDVKQKTVAPCWSKYPYTMYYVYVERRR